ncbi:MAG: tricarballylate utilization 4Fe-4S protein TcuB [Proteobacteria bacterium]|nr:tricarballylate utilization 4Fe-4S protein TcuB [Pseudomonadota bacterium]
MTVCNACRYCEGFCAVFPAMERRLTFSDPDLKYLANLCHNCRGCYYACQYAPPHEFALNVPKALGELRLETWREFAWPRFFRGLFRHGGPTVWLAAAVPAAIVLLLVLVFQGPGALIHLQAGRAGFYGVIPYKLMVVPFSGLGLLVLAALLVEFARFWRETGGRLAELAGPGALLPAIWDALRLKYLDGGGHGCNYPDDRFSHNRRWLHHFVFYGFLLCFLSTTVAAILEHLLGRRAPYRFLSWPVVLGTMGGLSLLVGTGGLLYLKGKMDPRPAASGASELDVGFLVMLFLTSLTGLLLLILRQTPVMGLLLAVHVGIVAGLFITLPYGKFVHAVYRFAALARNAVERSREEDH